MNDGDREWLAQLLAEETERRQRCDRLLGERVEAIEDASRESFHAQLRHSNRTRVLLTVVIIAAAAIQHWAPDVLRILVELWH